MSQRITRVPNGLLSLIGNTAGGEAPHLLADEVSPAIDVGKMLEVQRYTYSRVSVPAAAAPSPGINGVVTVPLGEYWFVHSVSIYSQAVLGAGVSGRWRVGAFADGYTAISPAAVSAVAGEWPTLGWDLNRWYGPGFYFGVLQEAVAGGGAALYLNVTYSRLA